MIPRRRVAAWADSSLDILETSLSSALPLRSTTAYATTRSVCNMSILVRPTVSHKSSSGRRSLGKFDEARLLTDLANMRDDGVRQFRKMWKLYSASDDEFLKGYRDELQLLWEHAAPMAESEWRDQPVNAATVESVCEGMTDHKKHLFTQWLNEAWPPGASLEQMICESWLNRELGSLHVDWTPRRKGIRPDARSLPSVLAWACLMHADYLNVCRSRDCPAPYFISGRKDQKYCSPECAAPAKRAAKLKWWHENIGKKAPGRQPAARSKRKKGER